MLQGTEFREYFSRRSVFLRKRAVRSLHISPEHQVCAKMNLQSSMQVKCYRVSDIGLGHTHRMDVIFTGAARAVSIKLRILGSGYANYIVNGLWPRFFFFSFYNA